VTAVLNVTPSVYGHWRWKIGEKSLSSQRNVIIVSNLQVIRQFNINSNEYLERTDRKSRDVIALRQLGYRYRITKLEYEKLKNLQYKHLKARVII